MAIHAQGDHVFNDWRDPFRDLRRSLSAQFSTRPQILDKICDTFSPMSLDSQIDALRQISVTCGGHPTDYDQNSMSYGQLKNRFAESLQLYAVGRALGTNSTAGDMLDKLNLLTAFKQLATASIDEQAAGRYVEAAGPGREARRVQIDGGRRHYQVTAPARLQAILSGPWSAAGGR